MNSTHRTFIARAGAVASASALLVLAGGTAANAADVGTNAECSGDGPDIAVTNVATAYVPGDLRVFGDGGATITISAGKQSTASADVSVSGTVTADAVVASASVTAGVSLGVAETITQNASVSYVVPDGLTSQYAELGAAGRSFSWSATTYNRACAVTDQQSGTSIAPTSDPYVTKSW